MADREIEINKVSQKDLCTNEQVSEKWTKIHEIKLTLMMARLCQDDVKMKSTLTSLTTWSSESSTSMVVDRDPRKKEKQFFSSPRFIYRWLTSYPQVTSI